MAVKSFRKAPTGRVFKTLITEVDGRLVAGVVPVPADLVRAADATVASIGSAPRP